MKVLSICIPSYNRAELLRSCLLSLIPQINEFKDEVELVISDDCSQDHTEEVIIWAQHQCCFGYHRQRENIGPAKNNIYVTTQMATGMFVWILGNDDFIKPGAIKKVLEIIRENPEIWYVHVNYASLTVYELEAYPKPTTGADFPNTLPVQNKDAEEYYVWKWETLIRPEVSDVFMGGIQMAVVRREVWVTYAPRLVIGEMHSSLASTYPQIILFAKGLIGKPAYHIGKPYIVVVDGAREWLENVPKICLVYLHEALDCYEVHGVDHDQIERCRKHLVKNNCHFIMEMLKGKDMKGIDRIFMMDYIAKYWKYMGAAFVRKVLK